MSQLVQGSQPLAAPQALFAADPGVGGGRTGVRQGPVIPRDLFLAILPFPLSVNLLHSDPKEMVHRTAERRKHSY